MLLMEIIVVGVVIPAVIEGRRRGEGLELWSALNNMRLFEGPRFT